MSTTLWNTARTRVNGGLLLKLFFLAPSMGDADEHYSVAASPDGLLIRDPTYRSRFEPAGTRFVPWREIDGARVVQLGGSAYLSIRRAKGSPLHVGRTEGVSSEGWADRLDKIRQYASSEGITAAGLDGS